MNGKILISVVLVTSFASGIPRVYGLEEAPVAETTASAKDISVFKETLSDDFTLQQYADLGKRYELSEEFVYDPLYKFIQTHKAYRVYYNNDPRNTMRRDLLRAAIPKLRASLKKEFASLVLRYKREPENRPSIRKEMGEKLQLMAVWGAEIPSKFNLAYEKAGEAERVDEAINRALKSWEMDAVVDRLVNASSAYKRPPELALMRRESEDKDIAEARRLAEDIERARFALMEPVHALNVSMVALVVDEASAWTGPYSEAARHMVLVPLMNYLLEAESIEIARNFLEIPAEARERTSDQQRNIIRHIYRLGTHTNASILGKIIAFERAKFGKERYSPAWLYEAPDNANELVLALIVNDLARSALDEPDPAPKRELFTKAELQKTSESMVSRQVPKLLPALKQLFLRGGLLQLLITALQVYIGYKGIVYANQGDFANSFSMIIAAIGMACLVLGVFPRVRAWKLSRSLPTSPPKMSGKEG